MLLPNLPDHLESEALLEKMGQMEELERPVLRDLPDLLDPSYLLVSLAALYFVNKPEHHTREYLFYPLDHLETKFLACSSFFARSLRRVQNSSPSLLRCVQKFPQEMPSPHLNNSEPSLISKWIECTRLKLGEPYSRRHSHSSRLFFTEDPANEDGEVNKTYPPNHGTIFLHSLWCASGDMGQVSVACSLELRTFELNWRPFTLFGGLRAVYVHEIFSRHT